MANPKVRPHLKFYPEDSQKNISEARQADRWLHEIDDEDLTPMARLGTRDYHRDFYIHEPAMLRSGEVCMPVRWFSVGEVLFAKCWQMQTITTEYGQAWRVLKCDDYVVPLSQFLNSFPDLCSEVDSGRSSLPHPSMIHGK